MKKTNKKIISLLFIVLLTSIFTFGCTSQKKDSEAVGLFDGNSENIVTGSIEAKEVSVNTKIPGRIKKLNIVEGDEIKGGDILVQISSDEIEAKKEQAEAVIKAARASYEAAEGQVTAAKSMLDKAQNGARKQEIAQAQEYVNLMEKTYERVKKLYKKGAVSAQKKDEVSTQLKVAKEKLSMAKEGARSEDINGAQALVAQALAMKQAASGKLEQAKGALQEVEAYLKDTKIKSPINGSITALNANEGELVSTGMSIATITDFENTWVEINIEETKLDKISLNDELEIKISSSPDKVFKGKVVHINRKPDFATKRATNDNGGFDIVTYGVKIKIDNKDRLLLPGMTAFVKLPK
ncbi:HlyD family secretion protein [Dethiothermospora halolimnae]|uniref:HlyD family secretion protein n=1 Tax=Dethiothermospora halolimnae TaxID=3114390 RepID=UPI003CCC1E9A